MKLEVGMYVRDDKGYISKINWISSQIWEGVNIVKATIHLDNDITLIYPDDKFKASNNILDLIEVGDYVNGCLVLDFETLQNREKAIIVNALDSYGWGQGVIPVSEIKSIVTKEQFALMKYEVK